jgi:putative ABC transport system permease protein
MRSLWALEVALRASWSVLRRNCGRSLVTLVICGLGTGGVILAGTLGDANVKQMQGRIRDLGGGLIVVSPNKLTSTPGRVRQIEHFISLQPEDALALARQIPEVHAAVPVVARTTTVRLERRAARVRLVGTTPHYAVVRSFPLAKGRFLSPGDGAERVIVLGHAVSKELAPDGVRVGVMVALGGQPFEVVGILQPQGVNFAGEDEDHQVFIPLETYRQRIANRPWLSLVYLQVSVGADSAAVAEKVRTLLRSRHGQWPEQADDVVIRDFAELAGQQSGLMQTVVWAQAVVAVLLLGLGAVGVATLMLLVVRERRAEIGLRRALGATPTDIAIQFLLEGMILAGVGVVVGLGAGLGAVAGWGLVRGAAAPVSWTWVVVAAGSSLAASALACLFPAVAAARLEPAGALRS